MKLKSLTCVRLFATPRTIQSMELSRPEYWSGLPFPSPGDLPDPGTEARYPALQADSLLTEPPGNYQVLLSKSLNIKTKVIHTGKYLLYIF